MATEDTCNINTSEKQTKFCIDPSEAHNIKHELPGRKTLSVSAWEAALGAYLIYLRCVGFFRLVVFLGVSLHRGITGWWRCQNWYWPKQHGAQKNCLWEGSVTGISAFLSSKTLAQEVLHSHFHPQMMNMQWYTISFKYMRSSPDFGDCICRNQRKCICYCDKVS